MNAINENIEIKNKETKLKILFEKLRIDNSNHNEFLNRLNKKRENLKLLFQISISFWIFILTQIFGQGIKFPLIWAIISFFMIITPFAYFYFKFKEGKEERKEKWIQIDYFGELLKRLNEVWVITPTQLIGEKIKSGDYLTFDITTKKLKKETKEELISFQKKLIERYCGNSLKKIKIGQKINNSNFLVSFRSFSSFNSICKENKGIYNLKDKSGKVKGVFYGKSLIGMFDSKILKIKGEIIKGENNSEKILKIRKFEIIKTEKFFPSWRKFRRV